MLSFQLISGDFESPSGFEARIYRMALRFGNTTRLHHIDFPAASTETETSTCEETSANNTVIQPEVKPTSTQVSRQKKAKVNVRIRKRQEKPEITRKVPRDRNIQSLSSTQIKNETLNSGSCGFSQDGLPNRPSTFNAISQQATMCYMNLTVEWDVLDSFSEFAAFLEVQNPICPAHLIDTPEKLLSVLSCEL